MSTISAFVGKYRFLSNFYPCRIHLDGVFYPSVEHAYQAAKTADPGERKTIREAATPGEAKKAGRKVTLRPGWCEDMQLKIMKKLLQQKFSVEPLKSLLLDTGDAELVEGNTWRDTFWGVCNGQGKNQLGHLLTCVRQELSRSK